MPEHFRALLFIIGLTLITFWFANKILGEHFSSKELKKWQAIWLATLTLAVVTQNFWLFSVIVLVGVTLYIPTKSSERVFYYLLLICVLPLEQLEIPGFAGIRYLFELDYSRLMILVLLVPLLLKGNHTPHLFRLPSDKYIVGFIVLVSILGFRDNTLTNAVRNALLLSIDIFLPYFLLSRYLKTPEDIKKALLMLLIAIIPLAAVGVFENLKHWFVYKRISETIFDVQGFNGYTDIRGGGIRASTLFASPIILGYVMVIAAGILLYLKSISGKQAVINFALLIVIACLLSSKARGPWVGFAILLTCYMWTSRGGLKKIILVGALGILSLPVLNMTETGSKYIDMLPIIGDTRADTIDYRARLIENAWVVFQKNPLLGSTNYLETPEMESMRQGQGIIDLVNTYIQIALPSGILGLILFCALFFGLSRGCYRAIKTLPKDQYSLLQAGRSLFCILISVLFIIGTVSSIDYVPVFYWALAGIAAAYLKTIRNMINSDLSPIKQQL